jgi:hypothetical protein
MTQPPQPAQQIAATLEELLITLGRGIGQAQAELDRSSIEMQKEIDADPLLAQHGVQATWYQMPHAEVEIKVALDFQGSSSTTPMLLTAGRLLLQPVNARYQNLFNFNASATSTVKFTIVPVPAQGAGAPATRSEEDVLTAARPLVEREADGTPRRGSRLVATFNATTRSWTVLQLIEELGQTVTLAIVDVNDVTGQATRRPG